uniref:Uncharacterized protein n=1 Tax=Glossina austeni TaxID=7395 RepID=A0A1A9VDB2_GLOAU
MRNSARRQLINYLCVYLNYDVILIFHFGRQKGLRAAYSCHNRIQVKLMLFVQLKKSKVLSHLHFFAQSPMLSTLTLNDRDLSSIKSGGDFEPMPCRPANTEENLQCTKMDSYASSISRTGDMDNCIKTTLLRA